MELLAETEEGFLYYLLTAFSGEGSVWLINPWGLDLIIRAVI
jgi:hypothetical protein